MTNGYRYGAVNMNVDALLNVIVDRVENGIYSVDRNRRIKTWNKAAEEITGYKSEELVGIRCQDNLICHIDNNGMALCTGDCPLFATMVDGEERSVEVLLRHKEGHRVPVKVRTIPAYENGIIAGGIEIFSKTSMLHYDGDFVSSLAEMAVNDHITGIPNRAYLEHQLRYKLRETSVYGKYLCVVFIGLDNFRAFNEYYRSSTGDAALKEISGNLKDFVGEENIVGRWSDDVFLAIIDVSPQYKDLEELAENLRMTVANSEIVFNEMPLTIAASVGLAVARKGETADAVIARADDMLYKSKQKGKNCSTVENIDFSIEKEISELKKDAAR